MELLNTLEWRNRRSDILKRDGYTCSICHGRETLSIPDPITGILMPYEVSIPDNCRKSNWFLNCAGQLVEMSILNERDIIYTPTAQHRRMHVHHHLYIYERLPWQYADKYLITMCEQCHHAWHKHQKVKVYKQTPDGYKEMEHLTPCMRCGGAGRLPQYDHVEAGICFRCRGACFEEWITPARRATSKQE